MWPPCVEQFPIISSGHCTDKKNGGQIPMNSWMPDPVGDDAGVEETMAMPHSFF
jgi:hypothetical protein